MGMYSNDTIFISSRIDETSLLADYGVDFSCELVNNVNVML